jgi:hypothetical protein
VRDPGGAPLPPRRNVRRTFDVLGTRFLSFFPSEVTAVVVLESGKRLDSKPFPTSIEALRITGLPRPDDDDDEGGED